MNKEYLTIKNIKAPFSINYNKSFNILSKRLLDKVILEKETNIIKKMEVYNYFDINDLIKIIQYLKSSKFKYTDDKSAYNKLWNVLLNQEGEHIIKGGKIVDITKRYYKYYYYIFLSKVLIHRERTFLIKIYWNKSKNKDFFKLEITYSYFKKGYNLHLLDYLNSLKSINEILKKIEKKFTPIGFNEDFSQKISLDSFIFQMISKLGKSNINHTNNIFSKITEVNYNE